MQLLQLGEDGQVELNKLWIKTNPALQRIYERDNERKPGDTQARNREKAKREFMFLYKMFDPIDSEYANFALVDRYKAVARLYSIPIQVVQTPLPKATAKDEQRFEEKVLIKDDEELQDAVDVYQSVVASLTHFRLYNAATYSLDRKIDYLTKFDPSAVDKMGKLLVTAKQHSEAIKALPDDMASIKKFATLLKEDISEANKFKSTIKTGLRELNRSNFIESTSSFS